MKINRLHLDNIRSYDKVDVEFDDGLILIEGENGAGKSSLLGSIFSGLYLSDVLKYMDDDVNLDSLVKKGCEEGLIHIIFSINGSEYEIKWRLGIRKEDGERKASTKSCALISDEIDDPIEGVRDVQSTVKDTIGMNTESFVNSVYVKQGDITRMVNADSEKRKEIIDGLLGLSKLDKYVERMDKARLEFGSQKRRFDDLLNDRRKRLDEYDEKSEIERQISTLKKEKSEYQEDKKDIDSKIEKLKDVISDAESKIDNHNELNSKFEKVQKQVNKKEKEKEKYLSQRQDTENKIEDKNDRLDDLIDEIQDIRNKYNVDKKEVESKISELQSNINELDKDLTRIKDGKIQNKKSTVNRLNSEIEDIKYDIQELNEEKSDIKTKIDDFEDQISKKQDRLDTLDDEITNLEDSVSELSEFLDLTYQDLKELKNQKIPEARDDIISRVASIYEELGYSRAEKDIYEELVDGFESEEIDSKINEVEQKAEAIRNQNDKLNNLTSKIEKLQDKKSKKEIIASDLDNVRTNTESKRKRLNELDDKIETKKKSIGDKNKNISEARDNIEELNEEISNIKNKKQELENKVSNYEKIKSKTEKTNNIKNKIESLKDDVDKYEELRKNVQKQYTEKKQRLKELKDKIDKIDIKELKIKKENSEDTLSNLRDAKKDIRDKIEDTQSSIAKKNQEKKRVEEINKEINKLENQKVKASKNEIDSESVMNTYKSVKTDLREENIGLLNKYANEVFNSVYSNKIYQKLKIDKQYNIKLVTGDGIDIEPKDLSGGEKTILSLSIRAGVYRLLVERNENADTLPPFILDEPTTFLDNEHVSNLQDVINKITSWNVPQVFIVSHKDNMIDNADSAYSVEKDPATEDSGVERTV